jgi:threonyl-tRNA synthetase
MDLCAGTHVRYTSKVKAFKLLSIAGAYHRGDEKNKQLQRIYGTAFPSKEELATYLTQVEQARLRDHRKLGKELKLFHIDEDVGQGLVLWTPNGSIIRQELQTFISEELRKQGYSQVFTPHIGKLELYKTSGHFPYYKESQFAPVMENESLARVLGENCPAARPLRASRPSPASCGTRSINAPARKRSPRTACDRMTSSSTASC